MADNFPRQYRRAERDMLRHIETARLYYQPVEGNVGTAAWRISQEAKHDVLTLLIKGIERGDHRKGSQ